VPVVESIETPLQRYMHKAKRDIDEKKDTLYKLEMDKLKSPPLASGLVRLSLKQ
jgi:hypothetical protein